MGGTRLTEHLRFIYGPSEDRTVHSRPVGRPYGLFYGPKAGLTASLEHRLEGSLEGTSGGISYIFLVFYSFFSYVFPLRFMVLLKQLRRLYTSGFIFQVPPVSEQARTGIYGRNHVS